MASVDAESPEPTLRPAPAEGGGGAVPAEEFDAPAEGVGAWAWLLGGSVGVLALAAFVTLRSRRGQAGRDGDSSDLPGSRRAGYSLPEVLVVIGVIGLLISLTLPVLSRVRETARVASCRHNLYAVGQHAAAYGAAHGGILLPPHYGLGGMPPPMALDMLHRLLAETGGEGAESELLVCPTTVRESEYLSYVTSWRFMFPRLVERRRTRSPSRVLMVAENPPGTNHQLEVMAVNAPGHATDRARHGGRQGSNYLWYDLHVSTDRLTLAALAEAHRP